MQEHPVPRQITTFEFKLIGELTVKQFGFLALAAVFGVILFFLVPSILYLNFIVAAIPVIFGIGFAFVPINDRPMDVYLKNLFTRLTSPTQYFYHKQNKPPKILLGVTILPKDVLLQHVRAQKKLHEYLQSKPKNTSADIINAVDESLNKKKQSMKTLIIAAGNSQTTAPTINQPGSAPSAAHSTQTGNFTEIKTEKPASAETKRPDKEAKLSEAKTMLELDGSVYSHSGVPLRGMLVSLKQDSSTIRIFKTNDQGIFQNNIPLPQGEYFLEIEDPQKKHQFARMKIDSTKKDLKLFAQT